MLGEWEQAEPGVRRKIFTPGKNIMMMEVQLEKGAEGNIHSHPHEQITYCVQGTFQFTIENETHIIHTGQTIVIPSNKRHGVIALEAGILVDTFTPVREDLLS